LVDRMERETLVFTGNEAIPWLQGLVTNDLLDLVEEGAGQWNCVTNVNGRMIGDMRLLHVPELLLADLEPASLNDGVMSHFRQQIIMEDVTLTDRTETTGRLGMFGPQAAAILGSAVSLKDDPSALGEFEGTWGRIAGADVIVQAVPVAGEPGFDISFDRDRARAVWQALEEAGGESVAPVGHDALETLRIETGVPRFGVETGDEVIPLEANLRHLISFDKGCYLGQEIIARLDTRGTPAKRLRTLVFDGGAAPAVEADIEPEGGGREVGGVVSSVWSPLLDAPIALGYVKRRHYDVGGTVEVEGREARVEELGFPLSAAADQRSEAAS
ncbi:MAG: folate-binding protein YgfZ, partial [Bradymonadaceae bacterium]